MGNDENAGNQGGNAGIRVGLLGMREMRRIRVGMQEIMVGMQVYKDLTGILQEFCKIIYPSLYS